MAAVDQTLTPGAPRVSLQCMVACGVVRGADGPPADAAATLLRHWREALGRAEGATLVGGAEGLMAACPDPTEALAATLGARQAVASDPVCAAVRYRAALHVGRVGTLDGGVLLGSDVALCERVLLEARSGQTLISEPCAALIRHALPCGILLRDLGERDMPGMDRPMRTFELTEGTEPAGGQQRTDEGAPGAIRIVLVEDDRMLREALASLLRLDPELDLIGTAANGRQGVELAVSRAPDVVLMDIEMPEMDGIEATRRIRQSLPDAEVLILTKFGDDERVFEAIRAGALGYMLKDAGVEEIGRVVRSIHRGEGYISPSLVPRVMREFQRVTRIGEETRELFAELSKREVEVLDLLGAGMRNRQIADKLFISEKTVKNHISNILAKLQVNDRTAAALLAREYGLGSRA